MTAALTIESYRQIARSLLTVVRCCRPWSKEWLAARWSLGVTLSWMNALRLQCRREAA